MEGEKEIKEMLLGAKIRNFVMDNLRSSAKVIGYSDDLVSELTNNFENLDLTAFIKKHTKELHRVHTIGFFEGIVPKYFSEYIVPEIPVEGKILDLGCGTGTLVRLLKKRGQKDVVGIDINPYPEWKMLESENIRFEVVKEKDFISFIRKESPQSVAITWTLHHMEFDEQERYLQSLYEVLSPGSHLIVLEDSYAETIPPEKGKDLHGKFMALSEGDRKIMMGVSDWIANRVLEQRDQIPMPLAYRTLENWSKLFTKIGFKVSKTRFIGFPENRDINTPQSLLVVYK